MLVPAILAHHLSKGRGKKKKAASEGMKNKREHEFVQAEPLCMVN